MVSQSYINLEVQVLQNVYTRTYMTPLCENNGLTRVL